jgi:hypothetical protein
VIDVTRRVDALAAQGESFRFGRNEMGNQNLHTWLARLVAELDEEHADCSAHS